MRNKATPMTGAERQRRHRDKRREELQALRFALEAIAPGTLLEGAEILVDEPPGRAWCLGCSMAVEIAQRGDACPSCGGHWLTPQGGDALRVVDMQVA